MNRKRIMMELDNIINLCNLTIQEKDSHKDTDENINDIKNLILPELIELKRELDKNKNTKIHLHSIWFILDHWSYKSKIGKEVIKFSNKYKK